MIIYKNRNWKINEGFSIAEILISVVILAIIGIGVFQIYKVISEQRDVLDEKVTSLYFSKYIYSLIKNVSVPATFQVPGTTFYLYEKQNEEIDLSKDPLYYNSYAGFQNNSFWVNKNIYTHEITFLSQYQIQWVYFYNYKIDTSLNGVKNTLYITK